MCVCVQQNWDLPKKIFLLVPLLCSKKKKNNKKKQDIRVENSTFRSEEKSGSKETLYSCPGRIESFKGRLHTHDDRLVKKKANEACFLQIMEVY